MAPEYRRPVVPLPAQWTGGAEQGITATQLHWHDFFTDARLQGLIQRALDYNRDLRLAAARVAEARLGYDLSLAERIPTSTLNGKYELTKLPPSLTGGNQFDLERYDINANVSAFELDFWGRMKSLSHAAQARYLGSVEAARTMRMSVIGDVANAYYALLEYNERLVLQQEIVRLRAETWDIVQSAVEYGAAGKLELYQAESAYEQARGERDVQIRQRDATANLLAALTGYAEGELPLGSSVAAQSMERVFATGLPSEVLLRRPDVAAAEQRLIEANANIGAARAAFFPSIALTVGIGLASNLLQTLLTKSSQWATSFVPTLSLPLFDGGRTAINRDIAEVRKVAAVADYEKTVQTAFREVADLLVAQTGFREQKRAAGAELVIQQQRYEAVEARFRAGAASRLEVLDALRQLLGAQQNLISMRRFELSVAVQLYKALGGGGDQGEPSG